MANVIESSINFLRRKGILGPDKTKWLVKFEDGREFDIAELMEEYSQPSEQTKAYTALRARRGMILADIVADDIMESVQLYTRDVEKFFEANKDWDTPYNREYLSLPKGN